MKICSTHFKNSDYFMKYIKGKTKKALKKNSIPFNKEKEKLEFKKIICAANNCFNNNIDHKKMHFFPFPDHEPMLRIWARKADRKDILSKPIFHERKYYLCAKHFDKKYFKKGSKIEFRCDIAIIPTIFDDSDFSSKPGESYSNLFMVTNEPEKIVIRSVDENIQTIISNKTLQVYLNDSDTSKITFNDTTVKSSVIPDFGKINYSCNNIYENFVSNPGVLNYKPQTSDILFKKDFCRLCAKLFSVNLLNSIFDKQGNFTWYGKMLETCIPGKIHINDKLSHWMCSNCHYKLDACYSSIKAFIEADNCLRKIYYDCKESNLEENPDVCDVRVVDEPSSNLKSINNIISTQDEVQIAKQTKTSNENPPNIPPEVNKLIEEKQMKQDNKYQCLNCELIYNSRKEVIQHSFEAHNLDRSKSNIICKIVSIDTKSTMNKKPRSNVKIRRSSLRYECVICSSIHEKKDLLIKHSLRYHSNSNGKIVCRVVRINNLKNNYLTCLYCKEVFRNICSYRKHMKKHFKLNCDQCGKKFNRMYKFLAHVKLHEFRSFSCEECPQVFKDMSDLLKHQVRHQQNNETKCSICEEVFTNPGDLLKHKKIHDKWLCNVCGKLFSSSTFLKYHLENHNDIRSYKCSVCSKTFKTMLSLNQHKNIHSTEKRCVCQVCGKQFGYLSVLKSHLYSHSTHKPYICEVCGAAFYRRNNLKKHLTTHERIKDDSYTCKICDLDFSSRITYVRHKREHISDQKLFTCDVCSKKFLTKFQVKIHRRIHTGETPYDCEQCDKSFRSLALLKQHRLIHTNVFPHQCNYCDEKFRRLQSLVIHRRTHVGQKTYFCAVCNKAFANRNDMIKHRRNLHNRNGENKLQFSDTDEYLDIENMLNCDIGNDVLENSNSSNNSLLTSILHQ